jgi:hypothetical protein
VTAVVTGSGAATLAPGPVRRFRAVDVIARTGCSERQLTYWRMYGGIGRVRGAIAWFSWRELLLAGCWVAMHGGWEHGSNNTQIGVLRETVRMAFDEDDWARWLLVRPGEYHWVVDEANLPDLVATSGPAWWLLDVAQIMEGLR